MCLKQLVERYKETEFKINNIRNIFLNRKQKKAEQNKREIIIK